ncbi:unnamed protein product [Strongylus vulgaris]|uniref:Uncharacterized protein n=1 Tax=Strongylus vulgaris TaxID=40348 RepID=A0A3P7KXL9_STRVU|nr:unnamed protein product [Strongylus vulgaris]
MTSVHVCIEISGLGVVFAVVFLVLKESKPLIRDMTGFLFLRFAAATLLITEQHAEYGLEELPSRLNYCIDDLNLYKRNTDTRIRKLLIDDYQMLNRTIAAQMSNAGHMMIQTVKKLTGAQSVDALMNISDSAMEIHDSLLETNKQFKQLLVDYSHFESNFAEDVDMALEIITAADIPQLLGDTVARFKTMQNRLQTEVDKKVHSSQAVLKQIADSLFVIAEKVSTQIRQINFDALYDIVSFASDPKDNPAVKYVLYRSSV